MKPASLFPASAVYVLAMLVIGLVPPAMRGAEGNDPKEKLIKIEHELAVALAKNDTKALAEHIAEDWRLVDDEGRVLTLAEITAMMTSGQLKFESYESRDYQVRVFGDSVVVIGRDASKGTWNGETFESQDRFTDVFIKKDGKWKLVSSHSSNIKS